MMLHMTPLLHDQPFYSEEITHANHRSSLLGAKVVLFAMCPHKNKKSPSSSEREAETAPFSFLLYIFSPDSCKLGVCKSALFLFLFLLYLRFLELY